MMHTSAVAAGLPKAVGAAPPSVLLAAGLELALLLTHAQVWGGFEELPCAWSLSCRSIIAAARRSLLGAGPLRQFAVAALDSSPSSTKWAAYAPISPTGSANCHIFPASAANPAWPSTARLSLQAQVLFALGPGHSFQQLKSRRLYFVVDLLSPWLSLYVTAHCLPPGGQAGAGRGGQQRAAVATSCSYWGGLQGSVCGDALLSVAAK